MTFVRRWSVSFDTANIPPGVEQLTQLQSRGNLGVEIEAMRIDDDDSDPLTDIKKLDAFLDGEEDGDRPLDVLRERGIDLPDDSSLDDETLHQKLELLIDEMAEIGMLLESTDHLSDRELYRYLLTDALLEETVLPSSSAGAWHISPIGGCSQEDNQ